MPLSWKWNNWTENMVYRNPAKIVSSWPRTGIVLAFVHELKMNILFFEGTQMYHWLLYMQAYIIISDFDVINWNFWSGFVNWNAVENESLDVLHNISYDNPSGMKEWYDLVPGIVFVNS